MTVIYEVIQDTVLSGTSSIGIGASAQVTIRDADTAALVTLFQDRLGASGETNPFNADASGQFRVYAAPGRLQITVVHNAVTRIWEDFRLIAPPVIANRLINGGFDVWQRGITFDSTTTPANSDDTYLVDRWDLLSDGNDAVDVSREASIVPDGGLYSVKADVETPAKKFGFLQIIENKNAQKLKGKIVSLSFKARTTSGVVRNLRAVVLSWDSTADVVTSDVVSAWAAEGTNPTFAANWTEENTPADLALSNVFQTFKIEGISIDTAGITNLAVFIWVDDVDLIATDVFYLADVKLEEGAEATVYEAPDYGSELRRCMRYYERWAPGVANARLATGQGTSGTAAFFPLIYEVTKRILPSIVADSLAGHFSAAKANGGNEVLTVFTFAQITPNSCSGDATTSANMVAGDGTILVLSSGAGYIEFDAEL